MPSKVRDLIGQKFGHVTVLEYAGRNQWDVSLWRVQCDCSNPPEVVQAGGLITGTTKSCGRAGCPYYGGVRHGHTRDGQTSLTYSSWRAMVKRCTNENNAHYAEYGGRGILIDARWHVPLGTGHANVGFLNFLADLGPRPSIQHSLDRIDNDGPYAPGNVRWSLPKGQARNTRRNISLTWQGQTHTLAGWAEQLGLAYETLRHRHVYRGWSVERTLTTPQRVALSPQEAAEHHLAATRRHRARKRAALKSAA